jgi:hypothetical protein
MSPFIKSLPLLSICIDLDGLSGQCCEDKECNSLNAQLKPVSFQGNIYHVYHRLCGLGVRFLATDLEVRVRFPTLPDFLRISRSETVCTQPREYIEELLERKVAAPV